MVLVVYGKVSFSLVTFDFCVETDVLVSYVQPGFTIGSG